MQIAPDVARADTPHVSRRALLAAAPAASVATAAPSLAAEPADPLPAWNDGVAKRTLLEFVADVTQLNGPRFVPPEQRIATFDNDGTLCCEVPTIEAMYLRDRLEVLLARRPELRRAPPYSTLTAGDPAAISRLDRRAIVKLVADTHTGMTEQEFTADVLRFFAEARHPRYGVPFSQVAYLPQLELLRYLRAHGFKTWISSAGEVSFMRAVAQDVYGVPPEQVIGTYFRDQPEERSGQLVLRRTGELLSLNDKDDKPGNIHQRIGRRPLLAIGNERSGGDIAMLRYTLGNRLPSLALLIDHDDAEREYSYDERGGASLEAARRYGFTLISMKRDWRRIFAFQRSHEEGTTMGQREREPR